MGTAVKKRAGGSAGLSTASGVRQQNGQMPAVPAEDPMGTMQQTKTATMIAGTIASSAPTAPLAARRAQFEQEALVHLDAMYSFALKLTRARDDAEDLVSDTILRAFERWEQYRLGTNIRAWLFTILYHVFVSRKRRIDAREVQMPEDADGWAAFEAVGEIDPESRYYESFLDDSISKAIEVLPDEYRMAVILSDIHSLRYAEIAEILKVPEGTVKSRLFRGRRILQKKLAGYAVEMGYIKAAS